MKTAEIRNRLHQFIDDAEDKKVKALYTMFEDNMEVREEYTADFKDTLDKEYRGYKEDGITVSREEMDKRIKKILKK